MSKSLQRDFHAKVFNNVNVFIKIVDGLAKQKDLQDAHNAAPRILKSNRTIQQIIMDDVMDAFATTMRDVPDADIPSSYHKQILNARMGKIVPDADADKHLAVLMVEKRAQKPEDIRAPEFLMLFKPTVPGDVVSNLVNNWVSLVSQFGKLMHSDDSHSVINRSQSVMQQATTTQRQLIKDAQDREDALNRINGTAAAASPAEDEAEEDDEAAQQAGELAKLAKRVRETNMSPEANKRAKKELGRLRTMNPQASEYSILTNYLDTMLSLPWEKPTPVSRDLKKTEKTLNDDHYGMQRVKNAIVEHVAVQNRVGKPTGQIMLLVGPPGVGKTSIAASVAKATGRKYVRMSLGGVNDEAKIRGHRSTYIGAMPGEIVKAMIAAKTRNPLIVLDEIDKMGSGRGTNSGDPTAALLEALDPEQNHAFKDNYLDINYDLSEVMFFCTANDFGSIPAPLRDRMEVIHLSGYLHDEKFQIGKRYLLPKQLKAKGLKPGELTITDEAIHHIVSEYTREAGVRRLEKMIGQVCSKAVAEFERGRKTPITITPANLADYAGVSKIKHDKVHKEDTVGIVNGLAYTTVGGCRLPIQVVKVESSGFRVVATGQLGNVMRESIIVAEGLIRANQKRFGIDDKVLKSSELHLHAPEGAVPKDGPSAGLGMVTVLVSALTDTKIRHDLAMTGEVDLQGNAMKIGGLPEKLEGALSAGVKTVLIPRDNVCDLSDVPDSIKSQLEIIAVDTIDDVLKHALVPKPSTPAISATPPLLSVVQSTPSAANEDHPAAAGDNKGNDPDRSAGGWLRSLANRLFLGTPVNDNARPENKKVMGSKPNDPSGPL